MIESALAVGLIGCGSMGASHARQMAALPDLYLAAACDVDEAKARKALAAVQTSADRPSPRPYSQVAELLAQDDVPAVLVATPNFTHKEIVLQALAAGKDVFCEKPMALTVADCEEMISTADRLGRKLMVGQVLRLMTVYATVRRLVTEGMIGTPRLVRVLRSGGRTIGQPGPFRVSWRSKRELTGGILLEVHVHEFDLLRSLLGEVAEITAMAENFFHPERDYEDHVVVTLRFRNGGLGVLEVGGAHAIGSSEGIVSGEKGSIAYNASRNTVAYRLVEPGSETVEVPVERDAGHGIQSELSSFARWVRLGEAPVVTAEDGRRAVQLAEAAYRSARDKKTVAID
ncbi:MAG: Gfo/Idh/MocA family oxidoreductase [Chloroflexota bacterium]|nr:Gfo/Idh/MocA family oxidoreductase [Chloroflexota bacterium]